MDVLAILAFVVYIVFKSLGDRNKQQRQRQANQPEQSEQPRRPQRPVPHPLDQRTPEQQPWQKVMREHEAEQRHEQQRQAEMVPPAAPADLNPRKWGIADEEIQMHGARSAQPQPKQTKKEKPKSTSPVTDAEPVEKREHGSVADKLEQMLNEDNIASTYILSEVLQRPKALRR